MAYGHTLASCITPGDAGTVGRRSTRPAKEMSRVWFGDAPVAGLPGSAGVKRIFGGALLLAEPAILFQEKLTDRQTEVGQDRDLKTH
jgi:hypothetical protein